jgi:hypothetical protein
VVDVASTTREVFVLLAKRQRRVPIGRRQDETEYPRAIALDILSGMGKDL